MLLIDGRCRAERQLVIAAGFEQFAFVFAVVVGAMRPEGLRKDRGARNPPPRLPPFLTG